MKENITQLKKEIEEHKWKDGNIDIVVKDILDLFIKKSKLQTLQDVCKEIEFFSSIHTRRIKSGTHTTIINSIDKEELLKKFQGEEK